MTPLTVGIIGFAAMIALVVLGVRVAFAAAAVGVAGLVYMRGWSAGVGISGLIPHAESTHYTLSVLPMFILIGYLAFHAGITRGLFDAARKIFSRVPGGLAVATVFAAAGFAAVSGASTATAAVFARIAIPEMLRSGYDKRLASAVVAAGGTLAALIPPSALMVIYAIIVEASVGRLLIAGFIPGIISALMYAAAVIIRVKINPALAPPIGERYSLREKLSSVQGFWPIMFVVAIVLGGIYLGWMTPTESGAVAAAVVFLMAIARRQMSRRDFFNALMETGKLTAMIFTVIFCLLIFVRFLGYAGLPAAFAEWIVGLPVPRLVVLLLILSIYLVLGMFMDAIGMLILTLPVVFPAIIALGYDPIWFGIIIVKLCEVCLLTPPVGLNCYVVNGVRPDIPLDQIFRGVWPFVLADMAVIALFIAIPDIVTVLPDAMLGK
ncbi:MAG: TRAP transporter large permease [Rhodospirillales bacterium]